LSGNRFNGHIMDNNNGLYALYDNVLTVYTYLIFSRHFTSLLQTTRNMTADQQLNKSHCSYPKVHYILLFSPPPSTCKNMFDRIPRRRDKGLKTYAMFLYYLMGCIICKNAYHLFIPHSWPCPLNLCRYFRFRTCEQ